MEDVRGGGVHFPVNFFDGDREFPVGRVKIYPSLEFKNFQSIVSEMLRISPNQISIYLVDRKTLKIPITGKANFGAISHKKDCSFLVVLKRSRRQRKRKPKQSMVELSDYLPLPVNKVSPVPEKFLLLRRNIPESNDSPNSVFFSPYFSPMPPEFVDYEQRLKNLEIGEDQRLTMNWNSNFIDVDSFPKMGDGYVDNRASCEECVNARTRGKPAPFHWCVYDAVTVGFRSSAGPIARPRRASR